MDWRNSVTGTETDAGTTVAVPAGAGTDERDGHDLPTAAGTVTRSTRVRRRRSANGVPAILGALRRDLADGVYSPRERLVEADLVERYRSTRAAVREALIQLDSERLVERLPNRGARVRAMTVDEAIEIAEVRRLLEVMCAGRAATHGTAAQRRRVEALANALRAAVDAEDVDAYLTHNRTFHLTIHDMARHETARQILEQFQHRPIDRFFPRAFRATPPTASIEEHERLADAIVRGDAAAAEAAMDEHIRSLIATLREFEQRQAAR